MACSRDGRVYHSLGRLELLERIRWISDFPSSGAVGIDDRSVVPSNVDLDKGNPPWGTREPRCYMDNGYTVVRVEKKKRGFPTAPLL